MNKLKTVRRRAVIIEKPSGIIAITGSLDIVQRKFFNVMLKNAKQQLKNSYQEMSESRWFYIKLNELKEYIDIKEEDRNNKYYKEKLKELKRIEVEYNLLNKDKDIKTEGMSSLLSDIQFVKDLTTNEIVIQYYFSGIVYDSLKKTMNKNGIYAKLDLIIIKGLKSKYSVALYELCKDYKNVEIPEMTVKQFKKVFGLEDKKAYNGKYGFKNIRNVVLDPAIKELNNNPDVEFYVEYQFKKSSNVYTHIKFIVKSKTKQQQLEQVKLYQSDAQVNILLNAVPEEYRTKSLENYLTKCLIDNDAHYLLRQIEYTNKQSPRNYFAYLKQAIKEGYFNSEKAEEQEKAEKERIKNIIKNRLEELEKEKADTIDRIIDSEKIRIYEEYINLLEESKKQELFKEYKEKTKELYPDVEEKSFLFEERIKRLVIEDIIAKNEIYQIRLEKAHKNAEERAEIEFQRQKATLEYKIKNGLL